MTATATDKITSCRQNFEACVLPHKSEMFAAAMRLTRNPEDAQDLVQDTLLRAWSAWDRFVVGTNCRAWLLRILTNGFINTYRRKKRHGRFTREHHDEAVSALYGTRRECENPTEQLVSDELSDEVRSALGGLGGEYRKVVELADLGGIRYRDIADKLKIPVGTVMSRLFRARRQLERQLADFARADYGICRAAA